MLREIFYRIKPKLVVVYFILVICPVFCFLFFTKFNYKQEVISLSSTLISLRHCLNLAQKTNDTNYMENYRICVKAFMHNLKLDSFFMGRFGEFKKFLTLKRSNPKEKCQWLTVGIGGTANAEKEFIEKYPNCQVFGVEPPPDQYVGFDKYGTVIPYGIGVISGKFKLTIRENTTYINKTMPVLATSEILDKYLQTRTVLYMTIDIEGFEYNILQELLDGKILDKQGITFCQIDAELHGFNDNKATITELLHNFNYANSDYIPIYTDGFMIHEKVTCINIKMRNVKKLLILICFYNII